MKMNKLKFKLAGIIFFLIAWLLVLPLINSANIGISPATVNFKKVLRGGYSERNIVVSVDSARPVNLEISSIGEIHSWLNFSNFNISVSKDNPLVLKISVNPPNDIPNGNYSGFLRVMSSGFGEGVEGQAVGIIRGSIDLAINVEIIDVEIVECRAYNLGVTSVEKGDDIVFNLDISNDGNIRLKPKVTINIWDDDQISIIKTKEFIGREILPTTEGGYSLRVDSKNLDLGQYWVDVLVPECYSSSTLTFDVLLPGALKANGKIIGIVTKKTAEVEETVPIRVIFMNTGEKEVSSQFKGRISYGENIFQLLESEKIDVPVSGTNEFSFYFTPNKAGKYIISGRVFYSGKKTFESSTSIEVISKKFQIKPLIIFVIYILLIILILFLFYKIRKEKRIYSNKFRKIKWE